MSQDFLAVAAVQIEADTRAFRAGLASALATVPKAIEIPIVATRASTSSVRSAVKQSKADLIAASNASVGALKTEEDAAARAAVTTQRVSSAEKEATRIARAHASQIGEVRKGLVAQAASSVGLRGAIIGANTSFILATAGAIAFGKALQSAAQFQTELATFGATTGATTQQLAAVSAAAKQLGADITLPGVNAQDAAVAMTELAKAGLSVQDSIAGARGVLQLATAAQIDNTAATELAASALNAFGLSGDQAVHVADVLANSANSAQGSITDIGIALQQASAAGRQAGLSLEETTGILTLFARSGIKGSDAGTLLRTMLIRLINPTQKAQEVMDKLGLHIRNATGGINIRFFDEFARKTRNLTAAERDRDAAIIAGQDAFRGLSILSRAGGVALDAQIASLGKAGTAADLAAARTSGLAGAAENLKNQLTSAGLAFGQSITPGLTDMVNLAADAVSGTQALVEQIGALSQAAEKPIDLVVNVIQKVTGTGGGAGGQGLPSREDVKSRLRKVFSPRETLPGLIIDFRELGVEASAALEEGLGANLVTFPTLSEARQQIRDLIDELNKTPTPTKFNETVLALIKIQKQMANGTLGTKEFAKTLGPFIARLQQLSSENVTIPEIKFPRSLEAGARQAAKDTGGAFKLSFLPSIQETFGGAASAGWAAFEAAGAAAAKQAADGISAALASSRLRAGALTSEQIKLEFQGASPQELKANLEKKLAAQQTTVADLIKKNAKQANIDVARQAAVQTKHDIDALQGKIDADARDVVNKAKQAAADRKAKAQAIATANATADQAVIDAFTGAQNRIDLATIRANATDRLSDNIALEVSIANEASREIAIIDRTVKDVKTRNAAIAARVQILASAAAEIDRLRKQQVDTTKQKAQTARDLVTSTLEKKLQLAQIIGKKDPILDAFNALIAQERKNLAAAKKADKLDSLIKLRQTIKDRNDFIEGLKKDAADGVKQATTAFDLLKEFSDTFNQNAGNLINPNQPFAGPTGFTADIAQFLIRRQVPTTTGQPFPGKAQDDKLIQSQSSLTEAILKLRDSFEGSVPTNKSTSVRGSATPGGPWHTWNWSARQFQEG